MNNIYNNQGEVIEHLYKLAEEAISRDDWNSNVTPESENFVKEVIQESEQYKALYTVLLTLFCHKVFNPEQDIRYHQASLPNGFGARTVDFKYVTPFLKSKDFPAMAESGWLTRAFEHPMPYDLNYKVALKKKSLGETFLKLIHNVEVNKESADQIVVYMFKLLIKQRDERKIELAKPHSLTITQIIQLLEQHFNYKYSGHGASRLPTLAIYAVYQCMMKQVVRYNGKILCPLESHTSSDSQSGQIGDIQVNNEDGSAFEGVEIKHKISFTPELIRHAFSKFMVHCTDRYYMLTTANMDTADWDDINSEIDKIERNHGCQVIVNGVYNTLKYYLRLLKDPSEFINNYVELLKSDESIKYPHQLAWNQINNV